MRHFGVKDTQSKFYTEADVRNATGIGFTIGVVSGMVGVILLELFALWINNYI